MTLIDYTYNNDFSCVSNVDKDIQSEEGNYNELVAYIEIFEREMLVEMFDNTFVDLIYSSSEQKFTDLKDQLRDTTTKKSPIWDYVWVKLWQVSQRRQGDDDNIASNGSLGKVNSTKAVFVWNAMCGKIDVFIEWWILNHGEYPEFKGFVPRFRTMNYLGI